MFIIAYISQVLMTTTNVYCCVYLISFVSISLTQFVRNTILPYDPCCLTTRARRHEIDVKRKQKHFNVKE